jgi:ribosomal protein S18 acetylase RimI-like enzyme
MIERADGLQLVKSPHALHYHFFVGGAMVGEAQLHSDHWVWSVEIFESYRGLGYGRRLMELLMLHASANGWEDLHLFVGASNLPAINLYRSLGFIDVSTTDRGIHMRKALV